MPTTPTPQPAAAHIHIDPHTRQADAILAHGTTWTPRGTAPTIEQDDALRVGQTVDGYLRLHVNPDAPNSFAATYERNPTRDFPTDDAEPAESAPPDDAAATESTAEIVPIDKAPRKARAPRKPPVVT